MPVNINQQPHPKGLYILFATEMWERFNYYGMRAVLILFMTKALLFNKVFASNLYGSYTGLIYLTPLLGGYIADRYWGNSRAIIAGGIVMVIGEIILFMSSTVYHTMPSLSILLFFSGLGCMIAGNGFFKPNISSLVGQLYPAGDKRTDVAYTIFYMGINTGGALGPVICGLTGDTGDPSDFKWAFMAGGISMALSVVVQKIFHHKYVVDPAGKVLGLTPENASPKALQPLLMIGGLMLTSFLMIGLLYIDAKVVNYLSYLMLAAVIFIAAIIFGDKSLTRIERQRIKVIFIISFFVIFFWSAFEQAGASLTFFADEQTNRHLGWKIPVWCIGIISCFLLYIVYRLFRKAQHHLSSAADRLLRNTMYVLLLLFFIGIVGINSYLFLLHGAYILLDDVPPSLFLSLGSFFIVIFAPLFAWLWTRLGKYEPLPPTKMAIGLLFLSLGYLWIAFGVKEVQPGVKVSMIWITGMYALHTFGELCLSPVGLSLVNKLAPIKFASLLMAVWFLATAAANKLAGVLSTLYPEKNKVIMLIGHPIRNAYDFFMLFVFMASFAAVILLLITKRLTAMTILKK
ncbi:POT family proton-dependent oligopeptide transporter [Chitinophaga niastensis]|uniref:POT family proton-dependent oligopeptide transporter n=1 Tax=Chitinophaga niastensis TaxID=536980 RepID=A0A2P8HA60_CHINA|nr:peptide MFS transporter [Chitinophaga niastensis]PSL43108.1 POT family proton-dependent oligopeptide transporter [Chitinophaga niastensis]